MLKYFCLFLVGCFSLQAQTIEEIRASYMHASATKEATALFYELMEKVPADTPLKSAYKGVALMMYSKQSKKPMQLLKEGKSLIEEALEKEPQLIELHLLRLSIQEHLPKVVPYRKNIAEDKAFILEHFDSQTKAMKAYIRGYVLTSEKFSKEEKSRLSL